MDEAAAYRSLSDLSYVSRETMDRLSVFHDLTLKWTAKINLISKSARSELWARHILDSAQVWEFRPEGTIRNWYDLGSGGGYPAMVVAAIARDQMPDLKVTMVESDVRKCAFLRTAAREMGLSVSVLAQRAEGLDQNTADVVSARALAPVDVLLGYSAKILRNDGVCLFLKGKSCDTEVAQAAKIWSFRAEEMPSQTDPEGTILRLKDIKRGPNTP